MNSCGISGCTKPVKSAGMCSMHAERKRRHGSPDYVTAVRFYNGVPRPMSVAGQICQVEDCWAPVAYKHMCNRHYQRMKRRGTTDRKHPIGRVCAVAACGRPHKSMGFCQRHYGQYSKYRISPVDLLDLLAYQGGRCALCRGALEFERAAVDHNHTHCPPDHGCSDCVRGLLCHPCNVFEGQVVMALRSGIILGTWGPLNDYLSDPPYRRWLRERGDTEDASLAA